MGTPAADPVLDPAYMVIFLGPFTKVSNATITVTNSEQVPVAYKVKTTNNARFKINPAIGILQPGASAVVQVACQPFDPEQEKLRQERFAVFFTYLPEPNATAKAVWTGATAAQTKHKDLGVDYQIAVEAPMLSTVQQFEFVPEQPL